VNRVALTDALVSMKWASRRIAVNAVHDGRVTVNGQPIRDSNVTIQATEDVIRIDGQVRLHRNASPVVIVFNKPIAMPGSREEGKQSLYTLVENKRPWFSPNGVLPSTVSGIVLLTNDKQHRNEQASVLRNLTAEYRIKVHRKPKATELKKIAKEIEANVGTKDKHLAVTVVTVGSRQAWISVCTQRATVHNILKGLHAVGIEPLRVERFRLGPFTTEFVNTFSWVRLTEVELAALIAAAERGDGADAEWSNVMPSWRPLGSAIDRDGYEPEPSVNNDVPSDESQAEGNEP
jgi:16S rRNA U516 pseudouridylate synthase RsuA-like enzyme